MKKYVTILALLLFVSAASAQTPTIQQYLNIKSAGSPSFSPDSRHMAYLTNVTGTMQVWVVDLPTGTPRELTNYDDNVSFVRWLGDNSGIIFGKAKGGDENTQFYWMKSDGTGVRALTDDPSVRHNFGLVSDDGKFIAYASNKRSRNFFDIYSMDLATGHEELRYQNDGNNEVAAVSSDGSEFIISRDGTDLSLDNNLYLVDSKTHSEILLTPHSGAAQFENPHFVADGIVFANNEGREFMALAEIRKRNAAVDDWNGGNREMHVVDVANWDVTDIGMTQFGSVIAYVQNRDGYSAIQLRKYETDGKPLIANIAKQSEMVNLHTRAIVSGLTFNGDQTKLAFSLTSTVSNGDIWLYDLKTRALTRVTHSDTAGIDPRTFFDASLVSFTTFDGRRITAWYYEPIHRSNFSIDLRSKTDNGLKATKALLPVIVSVHGGPEGEERPGFNALYQYYLSRGYAILAPNVRGSTGFGKTFTHLDDVRKREDSVKDLAAAVDWLKATGGIDPKKIAVMGGSYGGYMTLAAITLYPDLWAAAVDTVGIGNWETFLKNTSGYRRRQREVEYGSLENDGDFLRSISPLTRIDRVKCPLFVIAGKNDPRVPYTEAEQIVGALKKRGAIVEYKLYDDEGHGIAKLKNRLELYPLVADFLDKYVKQ